MKLPNTIKVFLPKYLITKREAMEATKFVTPIIIVPSLGLIPSPVSSYIFFKMLFEYQMIAFTPVNYSDIPKKMQNQVDFQKFCPVKALHIDTLF